MKIVAEKDANVPRIMTSNRRRVGQNAFAPGRQGDDPLDDADQCGHKVEVGLRDEHTRIRK